MNLNSQKIMQFIRYCIIGIANNLVGYLTYFIVTFAGIAPKTAITLLYPIGAITGYFGHSKYFADKRNKKTNITRYALTYFISYLINWSILYIFSDYHKLPHQLSQAISIFIVGLFLFFMLKYFVFVETDTAISQ